MNILFLTISRIDDVSNRTIYTDLMRKFRDEGHHVYIVSPIERRYNQATALFEQQGISILKIRTLNLQKTNSIEKGMGTILIEYQYLVMVKKFFSGVRFDLILYSTPPITFTKVVKTIKNRDAASTYLLLKDIFPQNAVDLGMIKSNNLIHKYFRVKENRMYAVSDFIGCMSQANVEYLKKNNPNIDVRNIHINPNSIDLECEMPQVIDRDGIRTRFGIPTTKTVFVYGGNLGKPQGIDFLIRVLNDNSNNEKAYFVIVGNGTEYPKIEKWFQLNQPKNAILLSHLPKQDYDQLVQSCDVGLIFLDPRFTIPNYPCRLLSYLEYGIPILAATDKVTDIGKDAEDNGYGFWCESGDLKSFKERMELFSSSKELVRSMGMAGYNYLLANFMVERSYTTIMKHLHG